MNLFKILGGVLGGLVILAIGLLIGHFGTQKTPSWAKELFQDVDEDFIRQFMKEVNNKNIEENLRTLSRYPHMATTQGDEDLVKYILDRWNDKKTGLDFAKEERYDVYLSFPDSARPNNVQIIGPDNSLKLTSRLTEEELTDDQRHPNVVKPYAAYAPAGNPRGKLVYAFQGKMEDFQYLRDNGVSLNGSIAIVRYGGAGRSTKAINAAKFGVIGLIVYTDPRDINDGKASGSETYPHSWYLPPSGVERGSYTEDFGDLLTPYYPAKKDTYRRNEADITGLPPIPTQPIGFEDADTLICALNGNFAPDNWQGSLSCRYKMGAGFAPGGPYADSDVQVNVYNYARINSSANVMGIIRGSVEPDRYIMYGNHRDSWVHGAIDPSSGTAVMLEITRVLGQKVKQGKWRPRRSIIFGSWGAEEFGLIGSTEFAEDYYNKLRDRTAAYINVDISVFANATLRAQGTPPVQNVIFTAAKQVQAPATSLNVYDNWIRYFNRSSSLYGLIPQLGTLGAGSDYAPFLHYLGITCMDIAYTYDRSKTSARIYPAYHTAFDTFDYTAKHIDPGFVSHQAVARTAGNVLLRLADSLILPLGPRDYSETLEDYYKTAESTFSTQLAAKGISLEPLKNAVNRYKQYSEELNKTISELKNAKEEPLRVRMINDQIMLVERAFINHYAFPDKLYYSHVIWASRSSGVVTFPGIADAFAKASSSGLNEDWSRVHHHITVAATAIDNAASTLQAAASI